MPEITVPLHRYKIGDTVTLMTSAFDRMAAPGGAFVVTRLLPSDGGDNQYRVKSETGNQERVVKESQLGG